MTLGSINQVKNFIKLHKIVGRRPLLPSWMAVMAVAVPIQTNLHINRLIISYFQHKFPTIFQIQCDGKNSYLAIVILPHHQHIVGSDHCKGASFQELLHLMKCEACVCLIDLIYGDLKAFHLKDISTSVNHML